MPSAYVPDDNHLLRYIPFGKLIKDDEGNAVGILADAFQLRDGEDYLSATWVEFHKASDLGSQADLAVRTMRRSMKIGAKSGFCLGLVSHIKEVCAKGGSRIRIIHEREDSNEAHVALRQWPIQSNNVYDELATMAWSCLLMNKEVLP